MMTGQAETNILGDAAQLVNKAEEFGKALVAADIKAHQLRRIYDTVQGIHASANKKGLTPEQQDKLTFLKPLLAYTASKNDGLKNFYEISNKIIDDIGNDYRKLDKFYRFLQSILAYHKYHSKDK